MTESTLKGRLPVVERFVHGFSVNYLDSLLQVQKMKPFDSVSRCGDIHAIVDFDGVIPEGEYLSNVANLRTLSKIGERSKTVDIHTSRIFYNDLKTHRRNLDFILGDKFQPVSDFPWLTESSEFFIEEIISLKNPNCRVNFVTGLNKLIGGNQIIMDKSEEVLSSGNTLVMIGSSLFDVSVAKMVYSRNKKAIQSGVNFFCFNTGHMLI